MNIKTWKPGDEISADLLNELRDTIVRMIRPGDGITIKAIGNQIIIDCVATGGGGNGGGFGIPTYTVFPAIPHMPKLISCKGQLWYAQDGYMYWVPLALLTAYTGG